MKYDKEYYSKCLSDQYDWIYSHGYTKWGYIQYYSVRYGRPVQEAVEIWRADMNELDRLSDRYMDACHADRRLYKPIQFEY